MQREMQGHRISRASLPVVLGALFALLIVLAAGTSARAESVSAMDKMFMNKVAQSGMAEVMMGKLALKRSRMNSVRRIAHLTLGDHKKAGMDLKRQAKKLGVSLPSAPAAEQKADYARLMKLRGNAFDKEYIRIQVAAHNKAVALFKKQMDTGDNSVVREFAAKYLGPIEGHTAMIYKAAGQLGVSKEAKGTAKAF